MLLFPVVHTASAKDRYQSQVIEADYGVTWMGFPVYSARIRSEVNSKGYVIRFSAEPEGLAKLANNTIVAWKTSGVAAAAGLRPSAFVQHNTWRKQTRRIELRYGPAGEPAVSVVPPESPGKRPPVPDALKRGTVDPLTAVLTAVTAPTGHTECAFGTKVFEGLRRTDVHFEPGGRESMPVKGVANLPNDAVICLMHARRLAGYEEKNLRNHPDPLPPAKLWIARLPDAGLSLPVQLRFESRVGPIYARLVRFVHKNGNASAP